MTYCPFKEEDVSAVSVSRITAEAEINQILDLNMIHSHL